MLRRTFLAAAGACLFPWREHSRPRHRLQLDGTDVYRPFRLNSEHPLAHGLITAWLGGNHDPDIIINRNPKWGASEITIVQRWRRVLTPDEIRRLSAP